MFNMAVSSRTFSSKTFFQFELQYCTLVSYPFVYYVPLPPPGPPYFD